MTAVPASAPFDVPIAVTRMLLPPGATATEVGSSKPLRKTVLLVPPVKTVTESLPAFAMYTWLVAGLTAMPNGSRPTGAPEGAVEQPEETVALQVAPLNCPAAESPSEVKNTWSPGTSTATPKGWLPTPIVYSATPVEFVSSI